MSLPKFLRTLRAILFVLPLMSARAQGAQTSPSSLQSVDALVTEGILTRRLLTDPTLKSVDAVVLDEFHERHLDSDLRH